MLRAFLLWTFVGFCVQVMFVVFVFGLGAAGFLDTAEACTRAQEVIYSPVLELVYAVCPKEWTQMGNVLFGWFAVTVAIATYSIGAGICACLVTKFVREASRRSRLRKAL